MTTNAHNRTLAETVRSIIYAAKLAGRMIRALETTPADPEGLAYWRGRRHSYLDAAKAVASNIKRP